MKLSYYEFINLKESESKDKVRPNLCYTRLSIEKGKESLASTDGHKLCIVDLSDRYEKGYALGNETIMFSLKDIPCTKSQHVLLEKVIFNNEDFKIKISVINKKGDTVKEFYKDIITNLEFPPIEKVIPKRDNVNVKPMYQISFQQKHLPICNTYSLIFYGKDKPIEVVLRDEKHQIVCGIKYILMPVMNCDVAIPVVKEPEINSVSLNSLKAFNSRKENI